VSDDRRHLELELLLQRTIPGELVSADEPSLLQELKAKGFDPVRHAALAERLTELLSKNVGIKDEVPAQEQAITETSQRSNSAVATNSQTSAPEGPESESLAETATSYLKDFTVDGILEADPDEKAEDSTGPQDLESGLNDAERSPVIDLVDRILMQALELDASDIHVEPQQAGLQLRFRQEGVLLSTALTRQKVLPDMALSMLSIGEETGEMDQMLSKVADFYEDEVSASVKALTSMLEPAMIVVVGGIVGSILLAMYLPMFTVFDQIQ